METRCSNGVACPEVVLRVEAAERLKYLEECPEHAEELLSIARRIAEAHGHGSEAA